MTTTKKDLSRKTATLGIDGLDERSGGFKEGGVYMISGEAGTGKTVLCISFLVQCAKQGEKAAVIIPGGRASEYIENAETLSPDFAKYYKNGQIEVIELSDRFWEMKGEAGENFKGLEMYGKRLISGTKGIMDGSNISRLVIDPITPMLVDNYDFINSFMNLLKTPGIVTLVTSFVRDGGSSFYGYEEYPVTGVITLGKAGNGTMRAVVGKMDGPSSSAPFYYRITENGIVEAKPDKESLFLRRA